MGTWNYFWYFIFSVFLCTKNITALEETTSTQTEANTKTEAAPMSPAWEGSSLKVPPGSEATSPTFPTPRPSTTAISMDTASGTAASLSLQPSSAATTRSSFSSSPVGFTDATTMAQKSSTSENTEAGLAATSHPSVAPMSPASSSTPAATGTGSGTVSTDALTDSPAPSTPSSTTSASTSSMSLVSETTDASLSSTQSGSIKMHALQLTSTSITQGQAMTEVEATSSSPGTTLAAAATTSDANPDTALPSKVETPNMNEGSGLTTNPNTQMMPSLPATLLVTPSTPPMMEGERRTEAALMSPTWEGSSLEVSARSKVTSATFPTPRPSTTAISMDTASGTAASLSLQPSSAATTRSSFSSSPVGFTDATTMAQKSSTSENTEAGLAATSHPSVAPMSSASSSTPAATGTGSGTVSTNALTDSPAPSSVATSHSSFSSSDGSTAATTILQQSSTSGTTKESLATTTHLSTALVSSAPSSTPAVMGNIQMTTVPRESAMARFTRSTANPIFTTTFVSGPCMPMSIKVQNVTGYTIQFSWTGGRRGSLHTISLMDGSREINKTTTNETKTVFEHLLPGHVYTVSVEEQSCAGDSRTSVTVRTDPASCFNRTEFCLPQNTACPDLKYTVCSYYQAFSCSVLLKNQTFNHTLYDSESEDYKTMSESIKTEVVREMRIRLKDDQFSIIVLGFRPGSVIADFISLLQTQDSISVTVMQTHLSQILKSKFGDQTEVIIRSSSAQSSTEKNSPWKVAVIVLGVLLGVALLLIFLITLFYIYKKKSSTAYLVEPKGLLGNFVYKHL